MGNPIVSVFGSSRPVEGDFAYGQAYELGKALAEAGFTVCNGGYGGTMEASAKGARAAAGHTIGVTCRAITTRRRANSYIVQEVPTFDLLARLNTLVRLAKAYVILPGGTGTLLELALVWELSNKRMLKRSIPPILLGNCWEPVLPVLRQEQPETLELLRAVTVDEVIAHLQPLLEKRGG